MFWHNRTIFSFETGPLTCVSEWSLLCLGQFVFWSYLVAYCLAQNNEYATWKWTEIEWLSSTIRLKFSLPVPCKGIQKIDPCKSSSLCIANLRFCLLAFFLSELNNISAKFRVPCTLEVVMFCLKPTSFSYPLKTGKFVRKTKSWLSISLPQLLFSSMPPLPTIAHVFCGVMPCVWFCAPGLSE